MIAILLAIIAGCLLFGSAAMLGFLEAGLWVVFALVALPLVVAAIVGLVRFVNWADSTLGENSAFGDNKARVPPDFVDLQDELDWANREGRWAVDAMVPPKTKMPPEIHGAKFVDWEPTP
ncbi:MAG: hypothetical protein ACLPKB_27790 [Xanthobacteraceae bacterium]